MALSKKNRLSTSSPQNKTLPVKHFSINKPAMQQDKLACMGQIFCGTAPPGAFEKLLDLSFRRKLAAKLDLKNKAFFLKLFQTRFSYQSQSWH